MSLKRIKDSILGDAHREAEKTINDTGELLRKKIIQEKAKITENVEARYRAICNKLEEDKIRTLTEQRRDHKMELLKIKNGIIEKIFTEAVDRFISDKSYRSIMERWLEEVNESGSIFVNTEDLKHFDREFISKISINKTLVVEKDGIEIKGGFIFKTARYEVDYSLDTIMDNLRIELTPLIAEKLFTR